MKLVLRFPVTNCHSGMQFNVNRSVHDDEGSLQLNDCKFSTSSIKTADVSPRKKYVLTGAHLGRRRRAVHSSSDFHCATWYLEQDALAAFHGTFGLRQPGLGMHWPASRRDRAPDRVVAEGSDVASLQVFSHLRRSPAFNSEEYEPSLQRACAGTTWRDAMVNDTRYTRDRAAK
jgi:hypothetical protein